LPARRSPALRLLATFSLTEDDEFSRRFPAERWARVRIGLPDGRSLVSEPAQARGGAEHPLSDEEIGAKYRELAEPVLGPRRSSRIAALAASLPVDATALPALIDELLSPRDLNARRRLRVRRRRVRGGGWQTMSR
jgi:2-methylcitrate dehydratase PrpD